ncbi:MAG: hypothetical protein ABSB19_18365 [Methylomonas sp.]|jgi:hypothetical protein
MNVAISEKTKSVDEPSPSISSSVAEERQKRIAAMKARSAELNAIDQDHGRTE